VASSSAREYLEAQFPWHFHIPVPRGDGRVARYGSEARSRAEGQARVEGFLRLLPGVLPVNTVLSWFREVSSGRDYRPVAACRFRRAFDARSK
jgi:hypothetical protein